MIILGPSVTTGKSNVRTTGFGGRSQQSSLDSSDVGQVCTSIVLIQFFEIP